MYNAPIETQFVCKINELYLDLLGHNLILFVQIMSEVTPSDCNIQGKSSENQKHLIYFCKTTIALIERNEIHRFGKISSNSFPYDKLF